MKTCRKTIFSRCFDQWPRLGPICLLLTGCLCGCASWSEPKEIEYEATKAILPTRQLNPDSVLVETVLVRFPTESADDLREMWRTISESELDFELRQRLDWNGLRVGMLVGELPKIIRDQLHTTAELQSKDAVEYAGLAADVDNKMRQLLCRAGRRKDVLVKPELVEPLTVLSTHDGQRVCGQTFERAALLFDLRAQPLGDGSARLTLTPEIQHGDHRQTFVHSEFGVRPEIGRGAAVWEELQVNIQLVPGRVLVVSSTLPAKALGEAFFVSKTAEQTREHVLLLIRIADTQLDELFAPEVVERAQAMAER